MGRRRKKAPAFVLGNAQEFQSLPAEQGFEAAYVQIGGVRITNHGLQRPHLSAATSQQPHHQRRAGGGGGAGGSRHPEQQPRQRQQRRGQAWPREADVSCSDSDAEEGMVVGDAEGLDAALADYLENVMGRSAGGGGDSSGGGRRAVKGRSGASGVSGRLPEAAAAAASAAAAAMAYEDEEEEEEDEVEEEEDEEEEKELLGLEVGEADSGSDSSSSSQGGGEGEDEDEEEEDEGELEGEGEEDEEEEEDLDMRGDTAMLRRLLRGFASRELDSEGEPGEEEEEDEGGAGRRYYGGQSNLYEALLAAQRGSSSDSGSSDGESDGEEDEEGDAAARARRNRRRDAGSSTFSAGYFYELRVGPGGEEEVVVVAAATLETAVTAAPKLPPPPPAGGAARIRRAGVSGAGCDDVPMTEAAAAAAAAGPSAASDAAVTSTASDRAGPSAAPSDAAPAAEMTPGVVPEGFVRFPYVMRSREQVRAAALAASPAAVMAAAASGGVTPAAPRSHRASRQPLRMDGGGGGGGAGDGGWGLGGSGYSQGRQRSGVKGALGGALRPGEKKKLRKEKIQAKRSAREASRGIGGGGGGWDVSALADRIADFVAGEGDVLALEPLGKLGTALAQSLAGVYGLRHSMQGSGKKRFLLLQPTDRTKAPDAKTQAKIDKLVAAEVARQRRGAAAGGGVGPAGMALQDVTAASVAAARRGGRRGSGARTPGRGQGQGKKAAGGSSAFSTPVAFVRSGVQVDGSDVDVDERDDEGDVEREAVEGVERDGAERELLGGAAGSGGDRTTVWPLKSGSIDSVGSEGRDVGFETTTAHDHRAIGGEAEGAEGEEEQPEAHPGLGIMDAQREWLAAAFSGLGFRPPHSSEEPPAPDNTFRQPPATHRPQHPHAVFPAGPASAAPEPFAPLLNAEAPPAGGAGAVPEGVSGRSGPSGGDGVGDDAEDVEDRPVVTAGNGVSYFRAHFCLGLGYDAEEGQIQNRIQEDRRSAEGDLLRLGLGMASRRSLEGAGRDAEDAADVGGGSGSGHRSEENIPDSAAAAHAAARCSRRGSGGGDQRMLGPEAAGRSASGGQEEVIEVEVEDGVWLTDKRRGKGPKRGKGRGGAGGGGKGGRGEADGGRGGQSGRRDDPHLVAPAGPSVVDGAGADGGALGMTVLAPAGELGLTSQQVKATGKKAAKEARRQQRRQQQQELLQQSREPSGAQQKQQPQAHRRQQQQQQQQQQQGVSVLPPQRQVLEAQQQQVPHQPTAPADLSYEYGSFERHGTGIGSRLMARMGWAQGDGLGRARQGRAEPLRAFVRPRSLGLGADG